MEAEVIRLPQFGVASPATGWFSILLPSRSFILPRARERPRDTTGMAIVLTPATSNARSAVHQRDIYPAETNLFVDTGPFARQYSESMIGLLRGRLLEKRPNQVILDVGGVGYLVAVPLSTFAALGELHAEVTLLIHTHVREDALMLYGFLSAREKHVFELLLGASGVGPSLSLKILSGMNVEELVPAIRGGDIARLTKIPGVGRKTAERMVLELKDKLDSMAVETDKPAPASPAGVEADVKSALINLGYDERTAEGAVTEAKRKAGTSSFEKLLRLTLTALSTSQNR